MLIKKKSTRERGETPKRRPIQIMKKVLKSDLSYVAYALTNHLFLVINMMINIKPSKRYLQ